ncbi:MAG: transposase [Oscillochloridaceae bacterium umkhey_bin13]
MRDDHQRHHRRSVRLPNYDYSQPGWYFVTICTHTRYPYFADPANRAIAVEQWHALANAGRRGQRGQRVVVDTWVVMPDHVHAIIVITDDEMAPTLPTMQPSLPPSSVEAQQRPDASAVPATVSGAASLPRPLATGDVWAANPWATDGMPKANHHSLSCKVTPGSLGAIVRSYKAAVARRLNQRQATPGGLIWQRSFHERIIRDQVALSAIRTYLHRHPCMPVGDGED